MKFLEQFTQATAIIPVCRQIIFRTNMIALTDDGQPGRISRILRKFSEVIAGRLLVALDNMVYGNTGAYIFGRARHFDHAAKANSSNFISGHCRVVVGILQFIHGSWACLPFAQKLYMLLLQKVKSSAKLHYVQ